MHSDSFLRNIRISNFTGVSAISIENDDKPLVRAGSLVSSKPDKDLVISVVITLYNGENQAWRFVDKIVNVMDRNYKNYELVFVDDGSDDAVGMDFRDSILRLNNARLLALSKHFGKQIAMTAGIDHAIGDFVVVVPYGFDGMAELIPKLVSRAQQGFDVVYLGWGGEAPVRHRWVSSAFYWLNSHLTGIQVDQRATDFLVLSRRVVNVISQLKEQNRFVRMLVNYIGYNVETLIIDRPRTLILDRQIDARRMGLALDSLISFSHKPLRYLAGLSLFTSITAFAGAIAVFLDELFRQNAVEGWTSLMVVVLLMFCILFFFLSVLSEYIYRILDESKNRPLYYVREEYGGTRFDIASIMDVH
ncbi:MAG TPA: glycosyltransferase [Pseudolabrys sp.]|nr:glycosyltransferase [Pseudolabrys sp.]